MKKPRRITKFTVETERTFIFGSPGRREKAWCEGCGAEAEVTTVAEAARETGLDELAIYRLLDTRALHFREDPSGRVLVCLTSLFK